GAGNPPHRAAPAGPASHVVRAPPGVGPPAGPDEKGDERPPPDQGGAFPQSAAPPHPRIPNSRWPVTGPDLVNGLPSDGMAAWRALPRSRCLMSLWGEDRRSSLAGCPSGLFRQGCSKEEATTSLAAVFLVSSFYQACWGDCPTLPVLNTFRTRNQRLARTVIL